MGRLLNIITPLHTRTARDYAARMADDKVHCSEVARQYGAEYWDGDRRYGYGGYKYDGRWGVVADRLIETYALGPGARILDVGCGKAHLLYELSIRLPQSSVIGLDVSRYGLAHAKEAMHGRLIEHRAEAAYPFRDVTFDLALSLMTLHNLALPGLAAALREIERVARQKFIAVESYQNARELYNLECWALTCESHLNPASWRWVFGQAGYTGDYEFAFFE